MNKILKLNPFYSEKIWGYEKWILSTHKNGHCTVGENGTSLKDIIGTNLPILVKIIKANDKLSVQVHPNDSYSRKHENDNGKTECWYILNSKENATLVCGVEDGLDRNSFEKIINDGEVEKYLKRIKVKKGDMIYIPSGTVHAIEEGIEILEIQQSSDVTYRMYDWGRDREMHIQKSLDVIDYQNNGGKIDCFTKLETPYFTVEKININEAYNDEVDKDFHVYTVISGEGSISCKENEESLKMYDTVYIPKGLKYSISGNLEIIKSY